jgi:hypothetical protein
VAAGKTWPDQSEEQACRGRPFRLSRWEDLTRFIDDGQIELLLTRIVNGHGIDQLLPMRAGECILHATDQQVTWKLSVTFA